MWRNIMGLLLWLLTVVLFIFAEQSWPSPLLTDGWALGLLMSIVVSLRALWAMGGFEFRRFSGLWLLLEGVLTLFVSTAVTVGIGRALEEVFACLVMMLFFGAIPITVITFESPTPPLPPGEGGVVTFC